MRRVALALALSTLGLGRPAHAEPGSSPTTFSTVDERHAEAGYSLVEFSVGSFQGFDATKVFRYSDNVELVPTNTAAFMVEYFMTHYLRVALVYHLPLTTEKSFVAGQPVERPVRSLLSGALEWAPFQFPLRNDTRIELQGMALAGIEMGDEKRFVPGLVGRVHLSTYSNASAGIGVYLGLHYMFVLDRVGPLYGIAYRF